MSNKLFNLTYGLGGAIVIIGALFKINHWSFGDQVITIGLITEAIVFAISAFDPVEKEYDWSRVYPQLNDKTSQGIILKQNGSPERIMLSDKLDKMLQDAKLDVDLMKNLKNGILELEQTASNISSTLGAIQATQKI